MRSIESQNERPAYFSISIEQLSAIKRKLNMMKRTFVQELLLLPVNMVAMVIVESQLFSGARAGLLTTKESKEFGGKKASRSLKNSRNEEDFG